MSSALGANPQMKPFIGALVAILKKNDDGGESRIFQILMAKFKNGSYGYLIVN